MEDPNAPRPEEVDSSDVLSEDQPQPGDEQIEASRVAARQARVAMDNAQNDAEEQADALAARATKARKTLDSRTKPATHSISGDRETGRGLGIGLTIAYGIIGAPIAGWLAGVGIDRAMGRDTGIGPWLVILGAVGGVVFAIVTLQRQNS
ncbi:MAG: AtpZ/AtpI family protein [Fimbriimonadaceae bacterium]|nr:AtpZ/AtpI family protein [Fimbriimonadaceae bacterium]